MEKKVNEESNELISGAYSISHILAKYAHLHKQTHMRFHIDITDSAGAQRASILFELMLKIYHRIQVSVHSSFINVELSLCICVY